MEDMPADRDEQDPIEIIDIPGERRPLNRAFFSRRNRKRLNPFVLISTLLLALVLLNTASGSRFLRYVGGLLPHPVPQTPVISSQVAIEVSSSVILQEGLSEVYTIHNGLPAFAPSNCSYIDQVDNKQTIGASPLWMSGFTGPRATAHLEELSTLPVQDNPSEKLSLWGARLRIVLQPGFKVPINLSFASENALKPPTVGLWLDQQLVTKNKDLYTFMLIVTGSLMLDPLNPRQIPDGVSYKGGDTWEILVYLFEAGCYRVNADWRGGQWQGHFAAGR